MPLDRACSPPQKPALVTDGIRAGSTQWRKASVCGSSAGRFAPAAFRKTLLSAYAQLSPLSDRRPKPFALKNNLNPPCPINIPTLRWNPSKWQNMKSGQSHSSSNPSQQVSLNWEKFPDRHRHYLYLCEFERKQIEPLARLQKWKPGLPENPALTGLQLGFTRRFRFSPPGFGCRRDFRPPGRTHGGLLFHHRFGR